ncbi:MAG: hypothetical protein WAL52_18975 [Candidatus Sulfotelmatobacter sp.]
MPFPISNLDRGAEALRHPKTLLAALGAEGATRFQVFAAAASWGGFAEADFSRAVEEAPGLAVFFVHGAGGAAGGGIEADGFAGADGLDGDDVPQIFGDEVGDEEVYFFTRIDFPVGSGGFDAVASLGIAGGGFDLNAEKTAVEFDDGIVAVTVSPGDEDGEAEMGGAGEEGGFGGFSATLAGGGGDGVDGDGPAFEIGARVLGADDDCGRHNKKWRSGWLRLEKLL